MAEAEVQTGIWAPVEQYACIDNVLRRGRGADRSTSTSTRSRLCGQGSTRSLNGKSPNITLRPTSPTPRDAAFLRQAGPGNRPLAFPYAKWHVTQWSVDQAAALMLCSAGAADAAGVAARSVDLPGRVGRIVVSPVRSPSAPRCTAGRRWRSSAPRRRTTSAGPLDEVDHVELYSCFPAAVRVQQRELGLPHDGIPTVTGGMAFAGGPFNNFTYQATAAVVERLRADRRRARDGHDGVGPAHQAGAGGVVGAARPDAMRSSSIWSTRHARRPRLVDVTTSVRPVRPRSPPTR